MYVEVNSKEKRRSLKIIRNPPYVDFFKIHVDHQRRVTTSQKNQWLLSPSTTNHTTHNQTKKNNGTMIPPRSPASSGSNFLFECNRRMSRDRSQSALHSDAFFVYVQLTNSLFYLLLFYRHRLSAHAD